MSNIITSPVGNIQFLALTQRVRNKPTDTEATVYTVRLEFDGSDAAAKAFRKEIEAINADIIGTKNASKPGNFTVKASTKFDPTIMDNNNDEVSAVDIPHFGKGSTGKAAMLVKPFTGNKLGGTINLVAVKLVELNVVESDTTVDSGGSTSKQQYLDMLKGI